MIASCLGMMQADHLKPRPPSVFPPVVEVVDGKGNETESRMVFAMT